MNADFVKLEIESNYNLIKTVMDLKIQKIWKLLANMQVKILIVILIYKIKWAISASALKLANN